MHDYQFSADLIRFAFILGVISSVVIYDRLRMTTGSLVVPGYLGVFILQPAVIIVTLANALIGYAVVYRVLPRYAVLYGRAPFLVLSAISVGLQVGLITLGRHFDLGFGPAGPLVGIGLVIPALLGNDFGRQGIRTTLSGAGLGGAVVGAVVLLALLVAPNLREQTSAIDYGRTAFDGQWLPLAVLISAIVAASLQSSLSLRSGGMIGGGYLAMISPGWQEIAVLAAGSLLTYVIVAVVIRRRTVLFGRRKFAAMLITGSLVSWIVFPAAAHFGWFEVDALATLPLTGAILMGLFANDMERAGIRRVGLGTTFSVAITLSLTLLAREVATTRDPQTVSILVAASCASISAVVIAARMRGSRATAMNRGSALPAAS
ncbi:MAG: poly-gamma-glutamate biosynthesis protein PgsC/CapC [bacterium]